MLPRGVSGKERDPSHMRVVECSHTNSTDPGRTALAVPCPKEIPVHPTSTFELHRHEYASRLARSHQERVVEAAHATRQPSENTGRPPDPRAAVGRSLSFADPVGVR
jgi:hypothetical protein